MWLVCVMWFCSSSYRFSWAAALVEESLYSPRSANYNMSVSILIFPKEDNKSSSGYKVIEMQIRTWINTQNILSIPIASLFTHFSLKLGYNLHLKKKSRIRETKHLSTDADNSTDAIGGWSKNTPKPDNLSGSVVSTMFCKAKSAKKNFFLRDDFRPLPNKNVQMLDHFFPLLFPKDFESLKIVDIRLREVGAKRPISGTSKVKKSERFFFFFFARQF